MIRRPPRSTRTDTLFPYTTLFRSFLHMMFEVPSGPLEMNPVAAKALDLLFILHADHEQNASTSTVRLVGSTGANPYACIRSEEHTSELQSLMRISYAVFCLKKKQTQSN